MSCGLLDPGVEPAAGVRTAQLVASDRTGPGRRRSNVLCETARSPEIAVLMADQASGGLKQARARAAPCCSAVEAVMSAVVPGIPTAAIRPAGNEPRPGSRPIHGASSRRAVPAERAPVVRRIRACASRAATGKGWRSIGGSDPCPICWPGGAATGRGGAGCRDAGGLPPDRTVRLADPDPANGLPATPVIS
jgi:hypothetical protein